MKEKLKSDTIDGVFYKINKKVEKTITAKYHKIKDWVMDPKGYFLIGLDKEKNLLQVGYCKFKKLGNSPVNDMVAIVNGKTAIEIVNTLAPEHLELAVENPEALLTDIKHVPSVGKLFPAPISAFAYADPNWVSKPITSPVDLISGDKKTF